MIKRALITIITWGIILAWGAHVMNNMTMNLKVTVSSDWGRPIEVQTK